jgi:hypothetical protein
MSRGRRRQPELSNYFAKVMTMTRWFGSAQESAQDPVWKTGKGGA